VPGDIPRIPDETDRNLLSGIFERVTDAFVALDKEWKYTYVNKRAGEIFNRRPEDLIGKHIWTEFPEGIGQPFHLAYERAMREQKAVRFEEYYPPYDRWFENIVYPSADGISIYFHDITASKQAEALIAGQKHILEMIANNAPLQHSLEALLRLLEKQAPDMVSSILLLDPDGLHVRHGAAPSLPQSFVTAIDGQKIGPCAGSCGTAMYRNETVIVEDIAADTLWEAYRDFALPLGLRACWSTPIVDATKRVLGSYAIYYRKPGRPTALHLKLIEIATHIAAIAITRTRTQASLRESEARYRKLFEYAPLGIVIADANSNYLDANKCACDMLGYTHEEFIKLHASHIVAPDEVPHIDPALNQIKAIQDYHREWRFRRKDGSVFDAEVSATVMPDGNLLGVIRDITERKRAAAALVESEERFRQLADNLQEIFWMTDAASGRFLYASPMYETIWGRSREALYSEPRNWVDAIHAEDRDRVVAVRRQAGAYDQVYRVIGSDGCTRWVHDRAFPVRNSAGEVHRIVGTVVDITEQRRLEEQFHHAQKMEAIGQLAGGVAHDFNNLLAIISGQVELLLLAAPSDTRLQRDLEPIRSAAARAADLTRQLLAFSRKQVLELRLVDLNALIAESKSILERVIGAGIELSFVPDPGIARVKADAGQLNQVLLNLVVNARDAMPNGGKISIQTKNIEARDACKIPGFELTTGRCVLLTLSDNGCGMSEEVKARAFEPFFTTKEPGKGTGLGLAVVDGIIKQRGGGIELISAPGRGTTLNIYLPAAE